MNGPRTNPERCSLLLIPGRLLGGVLLFAVILSFTQSALTAVAFRAATSAASIGAFAITATSGAFAERTTCGSVTTAIPAGNVGDRLSQE